MLSSGMKRILVNSSSKTFIFASSKAFLKNLQFAALYTKLNLQLVQFTAVFNSLEVFGPLWRGAKEFSVHQNDMLFRQSYISTLLKIVRGPLGAPKARGPLGVALTPTTVRYATDLPCQICYCLVSYSPSPFSKA